MMRARIGGLSALQRWATIGMVLTPGLVALLVLRGEPWRYLDRPLYAGGLSGWDPDFTFDLARGFVVSMVYGAVAATAVSLELLRRRTAATKRSRPGS